MAINWFKRRVSISDVLQQQYWSTLAQINARVVQFEARCYELEEQHAFFARNYELLGDKIDKLTARIDANG